MGSTKKDESQMKKSLHLIRIPYEEPYHLNLLIRVSNDDHSAELEFYTSNESLLKFAEDLENFPMDNQQEVIWELGSENPEDKFGFFFRIHATLNTSNDVSINIRLCDNSDIIHPICSNLILSCNVEELNNLGRLLNHFSVLGEMKLQWQ